MSDKKNTLLDSNFYSKSLGEAFELPPEIAGRSWELPTKKDKIKYIQFNGRLKNQITGEIKMSTSTEVVQIKKVNQGFIITIGCQTFVATDEKKMFNALSEYFKDPKKAEEKYVEKDGE